MTKCLAFYLILGLLCISCSSENPIILQNQQTVKTISQDEMKLSKEVFIIIGRGSCCSGHIISIDTNGEIKYLVGNYQIPNDEEDMPDKYDSQKVTPITTYEPKNFKLSQEKIKSLNQLISNEQELRFAEEDVSIDDAYIYSIYLDNKKIASGYQSRKDNFPKNLKALIDLIEGKIEIYELPGMA